MSEQRIQLILSDHRRSARDREAEIDELIATTRNRGDVAGADQLARTFEEARARLRTSARQEAARFASPAEIGPERMIAQADALRAARQAEQVATPPAVVADQDQALARWQELKALQPVRAASFFLDHQAAIVSAQQRANGGAR